MGGGRSAGPEDWEAVGRTLRVPAGQLLFVEGSPADTVMVVRSGRVALRVSGPDGDEVLVAVKGPGQLVGELSAVDGGPRSATAEVVEDLEVVVVAASAFRDRLARHPELALQVLSRLAGDVRGGNARRADARAAALGVRLCRQLVALCNAEPGAGVMELRLRQADLADAVDASREATSRALGELRDAGVVTTGRGRLRVLDIDGLRRRAAASP